MPEPASQKAALLGLMIVLLVVAAFAARARARSATTAWKPKVSDDRALASVLAKLARQHRQPAMAAALVRGNEIVAQAAVGRVVLESGRPVRLDDRFHIGSTTKGLTALLIASLVREGRVRYDSTLGSVLADLPMREEYRQVTVRDLLLHRAGVMAMQDTRQEPETVVQRLWSELPIEQPDPRRQRLEMARLVLSLAPSAPPGTQHLYSNVGFALLGVIAETVGGASFESLLATRIFEPLGMTTARVGGWPASQAEPDQPRGHYMEPGGPRPQPLDDEYVFSAWMNPAGGVHCSIGDYARYARDTLRGLRGEAALLQVASYRELHEVQARARVGELYGPTLVTLKAAYGSDPSRQVLQLGYGWVIVPTDDGPMSAGDGSGGTFFARVVVYPALDAAFVAVTTTGAGAPAIAAAIRKVTGLAWE